MFCPHQELNLNPELRRLALSPLSYGGADIGRLMVLCAGIEPALSGCKPDVLPLDEQSMVPKTGLEPAFPELRFRCPSLDDSGVFCAPHCATCLLHFPCAGICGVNSGGRTHIPGLTNQRPPVRRCPPYPKILVSQTGLEPASSCLKDRHLSLDDCEIASFGPDGRI